MLKEEIIHSMVKDFIARGGNVVPVLKAFARENPIAFINCVIESDDVEIDVLNGVTYTGDAGWIEDVKANFGFEKEVACIKMVRTRTKCSLVEAKNWVQHYYVR